MNIEKHRAFIESLEGEKGLPEEMHGWRFDESLDAATSKTNVFGDPLSGPKYMAYLKERLRRAESRQIPDLKERVKKLVMDAMDATEELVASRFAAESTHEYCKHKYDAFRALCEPEKDSKEVKL